MEVVEVCDCLRVVDEVFTCGGEVALCHGGWSVVSTALWLTWVPRQLNTTLVVDEFQKATDFSFYTVYF